MADAQKQRAAYAAVDRHVSSGMVVGLGTGSTAKHAVERIGAKLVSGALKDVTGIATSTVTAELASRHGVPLIDLDGLGSQRVDVTIDGADEVEVGTLDLLKGAGGALFREKMIESWSKKFVVVVDDSKLICADPDVEMRPPLPATEGTLGSTCKIPVEVVSQFAENGRLRLASHFASGEAALRLTPEGKRLVTPDGNNIVDLRLPGGVGMDPPAFAQSVLGMPPVLEHGLFLGMADCCIVSGEKVGLWELIKRDGGDIEYEKLGE